MQERLQMTFCFVPSFSICSCGNNISTQLRASLSDHLFCDSQPTFSPNISVCMWNKGFSQLHLMPQSHLLRLWVWCPADEHVLKNLAGAGGIRRGPSWPRADFLQGPKSEFLCTWIGIFRSSPDVPKCPQMLPGALQKPYRCSSG